MNTKNATLEHISLITENDQQKTKSTKDPRYAKIEDLQPRERSTSGLAFNHEVIVVPPDSMIEEIAPLEVEAEYDGKSKTIQLEVLIYVHSDYVFDKVAIEEEDTLDPRGALKIDIIFPKPVEPLIPLKSRYEFIPYRIKYTVEYPDSEKVTSIITYLQSSNPKTSRGTITTVKRPT
ncbi:hypothetical protein [uncultured Kordia sp.]|uniref:hypothetical protein n=1 Tax=uncultured Kordia sp. TaxID=507699 RepID=UPI00260530F0|nr:hypothetical protein [uncultured Kordia sp.]